jgi:ADP-ribosylglycohydrolase
MMSDDTEHTLMVAEALLAHPQDVEAFERSLARKLRWWFLALPAGVGFATARACLKLWLGFPPSRSGVFSAGNGPAMRSAIIGVFFANEPERRREFVAAATRLTHTDPRAETAALAVAEAAAWASVKPATVETLLSNLPGLGGDQDWSARCHRLGDALSRRESVAQFAASLGLQSGVSGYAYHTVPVALYAWLRHQHDFRAALSGALDCGGDTDTVGAIAGALAGAQAGEAGIPEEWIRGITDWPRGKRFIRQVARSLTERSATNLPAAPWCLVVARNTFFLGAVLTHGFRRLLPP